MVLVKLFLIILISSLFELFFMYDKFKTLMTPLGYQKISHYFRRQSIPELYEGYQKLPSYTFKITKLTVRSMDMTSPLEKIIDVIAKILFTTGLTAITLSVASTSSLLSLYQNNEFKLEKSKWLGIIKEIVGSIEQYLGSLSQIFIYASFITLTAIIHIGFVHWKNVFVQRHLVVISEVEKERENL